MTKREVFENMASVVRELEINFEGMTNDELIEFFDNEVMLLDKKVERSRTSAAKKREAGDPLMEMVRSVLTEDYQTVSDILSNIEDEDATASKIIYRLNALVKSGEVEKADVQVPGSEGVKSRIIKAYRLVEA